nr:hypothetical protein GCM10025730_53070 [Promicromonospora thailandica]
MLRGIDLTGTNVIVTGGHNGIGHETTRALAAAGATVTVAARNPDRAAERLAGIPRVETSRLDLMDPASVDAFVGRYLDSGRALHVLVNNAGIMAGPLVRDARGYESQLATNHLGHFQLTLGLLPALRAAHGARVVNLTSGGTVSRTSGGTTPTSRRATTTWACWPTASPRPRTCSSPLSWTGAGPPTASAGTPCTPASS